MLVRNGFADSGATPDASNPCASITNVQALVMEACDNESRSDV